jgi:hypothetical protein
VTKTKTKGRRDRDATEGPGLRRLRSAENADAIREAVTVDQQKARGEARARIAAKKNAATAPQTAVDAPSPAAAAESRRRPAKPACCPPAAPARPIIEPTEVPTDIGPRMKGMSAQDGAGL